ncbi:MAG TPA: protoporphyrinogen oxidase [Acidimicrobiales bacterium]|nr:protoporphyrinogen oxidase [Acidimicrobiales bacterium]
MTHVAVVGGGITGLACALELADAGIEVTLLESDGRLGGKIRTSSFAGLDVDEAADAFLARVPEGIDLCTRLGLDDALVSPARAGAYVWSRGSLRRLPDGLALGVPGEILPVALSGILSVGGMARAALEPVLPRRPLSDADALGPLVSSRFGREVLERLVDPLIGGINAGDADRLSAAAVAPQIAGVAARSRSMLLGLRSERRAHPPDPDAPVFFTLRGGMGDLVDGLRAALVERGVAIELGASVDSLELDGPPTCPHVHIAAATSAANRHRIDADAVVLCCPAWVSAGLLGDIAPDTAATLRAIDYASVALVTLAFDDAGIARDLDATGLLVPKPEQQTVTAASWGSTKWAQWKRPGQTIVRASAGRDGDEHALDLDDDALVDAVIADLQRLMAVRAAPTQVRVTRWPRSLPQYRPGHLERIDGAERALAARTSTVLLAGAAHRGLGIPACIRQGQAAARSVATRLRAGTASA